MGSLESLTSRRFEAPRPGSYVCAVVGTIGLAYCLAALWIGMRMVMDVGGYCASGGSAYVIQQQCPEGSALLVAPSIPVGFVFGAMMAWGFAGIARGGAGLVFLFWPALFLSLGWNFFEGALNPPGGGGLEVGWLVCGIVFVLMGALPLFAVPRFFREVEERRPLVFGILAGGSVIGVFLADRLAQAIS